MGVQENFWILFSKKVAKEASAAELEEFEKLILENPEWQYAIQNIEDLWATKSKENLMEGEDAFMLLLNRIEEKYSTDNEDQEIPSIAPAKRKQKWYWAAASIIAIAGAIGLAVLYWKNGNDTLKYREVSEITTRLGSKSRVELPDGSVVWLNSGSKLTYDKNFGKDIREVSLSGEGFFDVTRMKEKPFIIHTSSINIKVLGTVFNVKAYPQDKRTETSLIRGRVEVTIRSRPNDKIILSPNEKLVVENNEIVEPGKNESGLRKIDSPATDSMLPLMSINKLRYGAEDSSLAETGWINNKLIFRDETFEDLAIQMERWYNVSIEIRDHELQQKKLNGIFESETIEEALTELKEMIPISFKFEHTGNKIIIHRINEN
ncbi:MAG: hypothetical protein B6D37_01485 [Sphingobacteriales bacterium UTBCD1]|jgi:ferric-dicitrate binding protein FerR (iron transport regulator)|nr:MAG: hypothetical protein B6D37_01485 [Sphingobacteriales bacterium UTBCD1]